MFIKAIVEIEYSSLQVDKKYKIKSTGTVRVMSICYFKTNIGTSVLGPTLQVDDILYGDFNYDLIQFGYTPVHVHFYLIHDTR